MDAPCCLRDNTVNYFRSVTLMHMTASSRRFLVCQLAYDAWDDGQYGRLRSALVGHHCDGIWVRYDLHDLLLHHIDGMTVYTSSYVFDLSLYVGVYPVSVLVSEEETDQESPPHDVHCLSSCPSRSIEGSSSACTRLGYSQRRCNAECTERSIQRFCEKTGAKR